MGDLIESIFKSHQSRYGHRRIHAEVAAMGVTCGLERVLRLMSQRGLPSPSAQALHPHGE